MTQEALWDEVATAEWPSIAPTRTAGGGVYRRLGKRALDLALGLPRLLVAAPVIAILAVAVVATSGWPAFYAGQRVGKGGRVLKMWKLRTMVRDADGLLARWQVTQPELARQFFEGYKLEADPRVTRLGRFLRRCSLDELPQLWSVVRGDMSLVGPRPITERELDLYGRQRETLLATPPGLTGRWQVGGRNAISYPERVAVELSYCRDVSLREDVSILFQTLKTVLAGGGR
jgi:lipopolysaccharide/colanic/teichoic acid biosynthesis glycosyltransferase